MPRKSKYNTHVKPHLKDIAKWISEGDTDVQLAQRLGISESTFYEYCEKYPEFSEALYSAKNITRLDQLESTLYRRAVGYMVTERKTTKKTLASGDVVTEETESTRHIAPDVGALKFILVNQFPDKYRDKQDIDISGNMTVSLGAAEKGVL